VFFCNQQTQFFRPLTGKYREQIVECLRLLYTRLYSAQADYSRIVTREQVVETFQEVITRTPLLDLNEDETGLPVRNEREQANWILNLLMEHGWIERQVDEATLQSSYTFSRVGRLFTQPMGEATGGRFRTRHRNTRNTRNALQSFVDQGEVYDLLDAYEYSERIISDFSDVIAELEERKRQLVREVESQQLVQRASDEFFDFMEKRFMPDLAVRLSADSVEKYRDEIQTLIGKARRKRKEFKANAERALRKAAPELLQDANASLYWMMLDGIESRMQSASEVMLPALRSALHGFTRRADIIIRQLSFSSSGRQSELAPICQKLSELPDAQQSARLTAAGDALAGINVGFIEPGLTKLRSGPAYRVVNTEVEEHGMADKETRRQLFIDQTMERAFAVNNQALRDYVVKALNQGHRIHSHNLPINNARELLMGAHAIEVGAAGNRSSEFRFRVEPSGQRVRTDYFDLTDEFTIELIESESEYVE